MDHRQIEQEKPLCRVEDVNPDTGKEIFIEGPDGGVYLVLLRRNGQVYAYHNECPHRGAPMNWATDEFLISKEGLLVCAHHGASFVMENGLCVGGPCQGASLKSVPLLVREGEIFMQYENSGEE